MKLLLLLILSTLNCTLSLASNTIIYGEDDRDEVINTQDNLKELLSSSTAALVPKRYLKQVNNGYLVTQQNTLGEVLNLCSGESFENQQFLAECTGFLVSEDKVATAGHCYPPGRSQSLCQSHVWVFDYKLSNPKQNGLSFISKDSVYECEKVLETVYNQTQDFALTKLKSTVTDRIPLTLSESLVKTNQEIFTIGHPYGLPMKITSNAKVFNIEKTFYSTNLDTFKGNSGSPVFSEQSGEVIGMLVRGKSDYYETKNGCFKVNHCDDERNNCHEEKYKIDGEHVNKIHDITKALAKFK